MMKKDIYKLKLINNGKEFFLCKDKFVENNYFILYENKICISFSILNNHIINEKFFPIYDKDIMSDIENSYIKWIFDNNYYYNEFQLLKFKNKFIDFDNFMKDIDDINLEQEDNGIVYENNGITLFCQSKRFFAKNKDFKNFNPIIKYRFCLKNEDSDSLVKEIMFSCDKENMLRLYFKHDLWDKKIKLTYKKLIKDIIPYVERNKFSFNAPFIITKFLRTNDNVIYNNIEDIKENSIFDTDLDLRYMSNIYKLPENLYIKGNLNISGTNIKKLPDNIFIGGNLITDRLIYIDYRHKEFIKGKISTKRNQFTVEEYIEVLNRKNLLN